MVYDKNVTTVYIANNFFIKRNILVSKIPGEVAVQ